MQLTDLTMLELAAKLAAGEVSSEEATRASLARIQQVDAKVRAFLRVDEAGGLGGAVAGSGSPLGLGAQGTGSTTDTVNGNFSLNKMAEENSKLLNLQAAIQQESQTFTAISNVMKSRNDTVKNSITNLR